MFLKPSEVSKRYSAIEQVYPMLKQEWDRFHHNLEWKDFSHYQDQTIHNEGKGHEILEEDYFLAPPADETTEWAIAPLYYRKIPYTPNTDTLPRVTKTLKWAGAIQYAGFVRLKGGCQLGWHYDPDPNKYLQRIRFQLPFCTMGTILKTETQEKVQAEGKLQCFVSSALHKVQNQSDSVRYALVFDHFRMGKGKL